MIVLNSNSLPPPQFSVIFSVPAIQDGVWPASYHASFHLKRPYTQSYRLPAQISSGFHPQTHQSKNFCCRVMLDEILLPTIGSPQDDHVETFSQTAKLRLSYVVFFPGYVTFSDPTVFARARVLNLYKWSGVLIICWFFNFHFNGTEVKKNLF